MAMQSLAENLQREGLSDSEKAEALAAALRLNKKDRSFFVKNTAQLLGYSSETINKLLAMADLKPEAKEAAAKSKMSRRRSIAVC